MGVSQIVVTAVSLVLVIVLCVGIIELVLPMYKQYQFSGICRDYGLVMESENGLSAARRTALKQALQDIGLTDVAIDAPAPYSVQWRGFMGFKVEGKYEKYGFTSLFEKEKQWLTLFYETDVMARKVAN